MVKNSFQAQHERPWNLPPLTFLFCSILAFSAIHQKVRANGIGMGFEQVVSESNDTTRYFKYVTIDIESKLLYKHKRRQSWLYLYLNPNMNIGSKRVVLEPNIGFDWQGFLMGLHLSAGPSFDLSNINQPGFNAGIFLSTLTLVKAGFSVQGLEDNRGEFVIDWSIEMIFGLHLPWDVIPDFMNKPGSGLIM